MSVRATRTTCLMWVGTGTVSLLIAIAPPVLAQTSPVSSGAGSQQASDHSNNNADRLLQQGNQQYQARQLERATQSWQQAQQLYQQTQNLTGEATVLANLGAAYVELERYQIAIAALEPYLAIAQAHNDRSREARVLGNLGIAYKALGHYVKAIEAHKKAGKLMLALGDRRSLGQVLLNLGNTFEAIGEYNQATIAYQQSLKLAQQTRDRKGEGIALGNLGAVYANLDQYDQAISAQEKSLTIAQETNNWAGQASALINLGSVYHTRGNPQKAITYYSQSLAIAQNHKQRKTEAEALGSLGLAYEDLKKYPLAIQYHQKSLAIAQTLNDPEAQANVLNNLGHTLFEAGRLAEAETTLRSAVKLLDASRPELSDTYKVSIFDTQIHTYNLLQQILVAAKQPEAALEATEQGRARAFAELLSKRLAPASTNLTSPTITQIKQIARQQNATLVEYAIVPDDEFKFRGKQRGKAAELLIWVVSPDGEVRLRRVDLKPLWQMGGTLDDVVRVSRCLSPLADCDALAQAMRGLGVVGTEGSPIASATSEERRSYSQTGLRKLYQLLIAPIADLLPHNPNDRVVFIPQESLFLVPFAALQDSNSKYLIEQHTILTAPSIQVLQLTRAQRARQTHSTAPSRRSSLIVGNPTMPKVILEAGAPPQLLNPLPGAEREALAIAKLMNTTAIVGAQATKASILPKLAKATIVHLATHGLLSWQGADAPGAIALAPSEGDSGLLTTNEILNFPETLQHPLKADLVVLSACDTGQGTITGDGVIGLSRAFIAAGVPTVVVSLWAIPDAPTARLMTTFYRTLQQQPDKAQALRQAMLDTMKYDPHPLNWAAFVLIGEAE